MTKEKVFETSSNGYRMFIVEDTNYNYMSLEIDNDKQDVCITTNEFAIHDSMNTILKAKEFERIQLRISTYSNGSKTVGELREYIDGYEKAIKAVRHFEYELSLLKKGRYNYDK